MFIFRMIKAFCKEVFGFILAGIFIMGIISILIDRRAENQAEVDKVSTIMKSYELNDSAPDGVLIVCPLCPGTSHGFQKHGSNFCGAQHEKEYWEMVAAWNTIKNVKRPNRF